MQLPMTRSNALQLVTWRAFFQRVRDEIGDRIKTFAETGYPTNTELAALTGLIEEELSQKPKVRLSLNVKK